MHCTVMLIFCLISWLADDRNHVIESLKILSLYVPDLQYRIIKSVMLYLLT